MRPDVENLFGIVLVELVVPLLVVLVVVLLEELLLVVVVVEIALLFRADILPSRKNSIVSAALEHPPDLQ